MRRVLEDYMGLNFEIVHGPTYPWSLRSNMSLLVDQKQTSCYSSPKLSPIYFRSDLTGVLLVHVSLKAYMAIIFEGIV